MVGGDNETKDNGRIKPVYFISFPADTPVAALLPRNYRTEGIFQGIAEAAAFFAGINGNTGDGSERINDDSAGAGEENEIAVVNGIDYYRNVPYLQKEPDGELIRRLGELKLARDDLSIRLLMPDEKNTNQNLLIDLMSRGFYDFWFLTALSKPLLIEILETKRDFRAIEAYLGKLPPSAHPAEDEARGKILKRLNGLSLKNYLPKALPAMDLAVDEWLSKGIKRITAEKAPLGKAASAISYMAPETPAMTNERVPGEYAPVDHVPVDPADGDLIRQADETEYAIDFPAGEKTTAGGSGGLWRLVKPRRRAESERPAKPGRHKTKRRIEKKTAAVPAGDAALFYSEEDCLMPYALAFLTACYFASRDSKTLLVELPDSGSRLAAAFGLRHPEKNLSGALRGYASGERGEWSKYCFNGLELHDDPRTLDRAGYGRRLPRTLYFLPDYHTEESLYAFWDGFAASLIHWAIMEEKFSHIIYIGFGKPENLCWKNGLVCGRKIVAFPPWPNGFNEASVLENRWKKDCLPAFDGSWGLQYIRKEVKSLKLKNYLIVPGTVKEDFIQMAAFERDGAEFSTESLKCLAALWG